MGAILIRGKARGYRFTVMASIRTGVNAKMNMLLIKLLSLKQIQRLLKTLSKKCLLMSKVEVVSLNRKHFLYPI